MSEGADEDGAIKNESDTKSTEVLENPEEEDESEAQTQEEPEPEPETTGVSEWEHIGMVRIPLQDMKNFCSFEIYVTRCHNFILIYEVDNILIIILNNYQAQIIMK